MSKQGETVFNGQVGEVIRRSCMPVSMGVQRRNNSTILTGGNDRGLGEVGRQFQGR